VAGTRAEEGQDMGGCPGWNASRWRIRFEGKCGPWLRFTGLPEATLTTSAIIHLEKSESAVTFAYDRREKTLKTVPCKENTAIT